MYFILFLPVYCVTLFADKNYEDTTYVDQMKKTNFSRSKYTEVYRQRLPWRGFDTYFVVNCDLIKNRRVNDPPITAKLTRNSSYYI